MRALAATVILVAVPAHAEIDEKGVRFGLNVIGIENPEDPMPMGRTDEMTSQPGVTLGAFVTWRITPTVAVQPELLFAAKELTLERCAPCETLAEVEIWYMELPVLLRFDLLSGDRTKFHLDAGPQFVLAAGTNERTGAVPALADELTPINLGGVLGLGFEFGLGPGRLTLDLRYTRWLISMTNGLTSDDGMMREHIKSSHQLGLLMGYAFP